MMETAPGKLLYFKFVRGIEPGQADVCLRYEGGPDLKVIRSKDNPTSLTIEQMKDMAVMNSRGSQRGGQVAFAYRDEGLIAEVLEAKKAKLAQRADVFTSSTT